MSKETLWGTAKFLKTADQLGLQRIVSVQNPYNLINLEKAVQSADYAD